jgi:PAS domain S-box-containing protein
MIAAARPRVLIVDDDPDDVEIARRELGDPFEPESVGSAAEALERLRAARFDLVLLDYRLGDSNALALLQEMRKDGAPPVIVVSGREDPRVAAAARGLGAFAFLAKDAFAGGALAALASDALAPKERPEAVASPEATVLERMSEALYAVDEDGVIVLANPAFERLLGYAPRQLLGAGLERVMGPEALGATASCLASGRAFVETELVARSGARIPALVSPTPLRDPGGHVAVVRDFRDIRNRIGGLERANRLLQANLVEVAVQVLHNAGNAAASLDVRVEDLRRELDADLEAVRIIEHATRTLEGRAELLDLVRDAARSIGQAHAARADAVKGIRRGLAHIAKAIDYARSFAGKTESPDAALDLPRCVETAVALAHDIARGRGLEVEFAVDVPADATHLPVPEAGFEQLVLNLLKNAVESVADRAARDAAAPRRVRVSARIEDGTLRLEVEDSGQGVSKEAAARAFQFGFTTKPEGSGFGLHASAEFVERLGGRIALASAGVDQGATITVLVPVGPTARAAA